MQNEFEMSLLGELIFFLGLQIHQALPNESHVLAVKRIFRYPKGTKEFGLWYPKRKDLSLITYRDADWVDCIDD